MNIVKYKLLLYCLLSSIIFSQTSIIKQERYSHLPYLNNNKKQITKNNFFINHGFSLSTSLNNNQSQSYGIYSNQIQYKISDKFQIKTQIDLIQSSGIHSNINSNKANIKYGLGLEYKLNSNSVISFQINNHNNSLSNNMAFPNRTNY